MPSKLSAKVPVPAVLSPSAPSSGKGYKWLFLGLLVVLAAVFLFAFMRSKKEGFGGAAGTILYFYMPGCGHCEKFNPEWEKLQKLVDDNRAPLRLSKLDGTDDANKAVAEQNGVKGFPTIVLEFGGKSKTYDGERTADAVYKWATGMVGSK